MQRQKSKRQKIILGLTGTFGSGKTTVAGILRSCGAEILDADKIAHHCIRPASSAYRRIVDIFGQDIVGKDKKINRKKLAAIVFADKKLLAKLNKIIHPQVIAAIKEGIRRSKKKVMVIDAPLLIEAGLDKIVDKLIVVKIKRRQQLKRIQKKMSLTKNEILKRIKAQIPLQCKVRLADFIIDNSGRRKQTRRQTELIRRILWKN